MIKGESIPSKYWHDNYYNQRMEREARSVQLAAEHALLGYDSIKKDDLRLFLGWGDVLDRLGADPELLKEWQNSVLDTARTHLSKLPAMETSAS